MASRVEHIGQLSLLTQPGLDILIEALEFFRDEPEATAAQLLELWRGTAKGAALERISGVEAGLDEAGIESEFRDCIMLLRRRALRERQQVLLDQLRERSLSPAETSELLELQRLGS